MSGDKTPLITLRPVRYGPANVHPDDLDTAARLYAAADTSALGAPEIGRGEIVELLMMPTADRATIGFLEHDGEPVGLIWAENDATANQTFLDVTVPPGPAGLAARDYALTLGMAAARRHQAIAGGRPWTLRSGHWLGNLEAAAVMEAHGFIAVRRFHRMRIDSASPAIPTVAPPLPDEVELVVASTEGDFHDVHLVDNDSFRDHWNFTPRPWDEWWEYFAASPTRDPEGWWLLRVAGEPAAILIMDESRADRNDGYVSILGVQRAFRGRGLAQLLLQRAFVRYRDMGRAGTQLSVDADNTTGAVRLYEKVGMAPVQTIQGWAVELD
jgi:mycothiol synthase